jgi:hypothetical protein
MDLYNYAPSIVIPFNMVHVFMTVQLIKKRIHIEIFCLQNRDFEGSIRTLVRHLQMNYMIKATNAEV